jgi:hypothetical protein
MPIKSLLKDEKLSDIKIESVNGKTFYCHKGVLRQYIKNEAQLTKLIEAINKK